MFPLWPEYVAAISESFSELYDDLLSKLVSLKKGNDSIDVYLENFDCASTRITLAPGHTLSIFLTNMNPHPALHVRQFNATTVPAAARIAKLHELSLLHTPTKTPRSTFDSSPRANFTQGKNHYSNTTPTATTTTGNQSNKPLLPNAPQKRVSIEEMQERKRKALCMYCEEPFMPGHQLMHRRSEFLFLEADPTEFDEKIALKEQLRETTINDQDVKVTSISVHALNGSLTFNCMRLMGHYGKIKLQMLIDPGSTHIFLDLQIAKGLGCYLKPIKPASVVAAGGDLITQYKCSNFAWKMQGYKFKTEIRTLPLGCGDLVLGVEWLSTLGPILWDFLHLRMEFKFQGLKHVLRGTTPNRSKIITGGSLNKQIFQEPQIAMLHLREIDKTILPQQPPPVHMPYLLGKSSLPATDQTLQKLKFCPNLPHSTPTLPHYLNEVGISKEPA